MKFLKVAGACVNQTPLDWDGNTNRLIAAIRDARSRNVNILCLPELCICGYECEDAFFGDYVLRSSLLQLEKIIPETEGIVVSAGLPMMVENCLYNVCCLMCNGEVIGFVPKQELAGDGVYYEPRWFKSWPDDLLQSYTWNGKSYPFGDTVFEIDNVRIGFEICEDAWNGIRPAQDHYIRNVDVILNPSASHFAFGKPEIRRKLVEETSRSYTCAYIYSNLLGNGAGRLIWDGEILIAQGGRLIAGNQRFSFRPFQVVDGLIDVEIMRRHKKKSFNFEPDFKVKPLRIEFTFPATGNDGVQKNGGKTMLNSMAPVSKEQEFLEAATLGLFDYMRKSHSRGFVISISGGADSAVCAVLIHQAFQRAIAEIGSEGVREKLSYWNSANLAADSNSWLTCIYQATANSSVQTLESAKSIANGLGATWYHWNVSDLFEQYKKITGDSLGRQLTWTADDLALQNIQARLRAPGPWLIANVKGALLVTTSNRSEAAVGYATMDGDTAGGLMPLGGVDKAFVRTWLRWAEKELNLPCLRLVNQLQPTAELRPPEMSQTDEGDLMPYDILEEIEECAIGDYKSPLEVLRTMRGRTSDQILKKYIRRFFVLWSRNQWKRERYAPSFHLDDKNLDPKSWCRFPILNGGFELELKEMDEFES